MRRRISVPIFIGEACSVVSMAAARCVLFFFFSSRRRHTIFDCDWSSDVCSSDLKRRKSSLKIPALTPLSRAEIFNDDFRRFSETVRGDSAHPDRFRRLEREVRGMELLCSREKLMAGLPNFATYFGRDMLRSEERRVGKEGRSRGWP